MIIFYVDVFFVSRRQELQELRKLQRDEQRQFAALNVKLGIQLEQMVNRHEGEMSVSVGPVFNPSLVIENLTKNFVFCYRI